MTLSLHQDFYNPEYFRPMLESNEWPPAIDKKLLEPRDPMMRGHAILYLMMGPQLLNNTTVLLDFGCGENYVSKAAPEYNINAVGYDIHPTEGATNNFHEVRSRGPYDAILVNDVLDHLENETLTSTMTKIASVLKPEGVVLVRCHPYLSRAGTHLPAHGINKAYAHLIVPTLEQYEHVNFIPEPISNYRIAFQNAGLTVKHELVHRQEVEDFFLEEKMWLRLKKAVKSPHCMWNLKIQYVEFKLQIT